ncbi:hypothetical protein FB451DRAFT_720242 [Mycena latifolia]|nr:hypothetical protein FB451DRAFT_720242 [Mycena latifolia]
MARHPMHLNPPYGNESDSGSLGEAVDIPEDTPTLEMVTPGYLAPDGTGIDAGALDGVDVPETQTNAPVAEPATTPYSTPDGTVVDTAEHDSEAQTDSHDPAPPFYLVSDGSGIDVKRVPWAQTDTLAIDVTIPVHSTPEGTGTDAARHHARLIEIRSLLPHRPAEDLMGIDAASALTWIFEKFESASLDLPPRVTTYMDVLLQYLSPRTQLLEAENPDFQDFNREIQTLDSMHIASAFLITEPDDMQLEARSAQSGLLLNDFNGRRAYVPLVLCRSWTGRHFITSGNFGLRVPNQEDLLSRDTWDLWMNRLNEDVEEPSVTLDLYAILKDDTDSCPHCKIRNPVVLPLPDNIQRCVQCEFTFLVLYQDEEFQAHPDRQLHPRALQSRRLQSQGSPSICLSLNAPLSHSFCIHLAPRSFKLPECPFQT